MPSECPRCGCHRDDNESGDWEDDEKEDDYLVYDEFIE